MVTKVIGDWSEITDALSILTTHYLNTLVNSTAVNPPSLQPSTSTLYYPSSAGESMLDNGLNVEVDWTLSSLTGTENLVDSELNASIQIQTDGSTWNAITGTELVIDVNGYGVTQDWSIKSGTIVGVSGNPIKWRLKIIEDIGEAYNYDPASWNFDSLIARIV